LILATTTLAPQRYDKVSRNQEAQTTRDSMEITWAVLIANSKYTHWPDLEGKPYKNIQAIEDALSNYQFDRVIKILNLNIDEFVKSKVDNRLTE
jgi:hypothetical protein